ncbi:MAG: polysaccharide biosynthesis protein [Bacteriovoracaceae bacterium]|nr:polysaccharide biosynthesis protein [Bacteriovoracaceae bacterium]
MFANKVLLITGGTGSFGNAALRRFLNSDLREIRIFSRDEKKQDDMRKTFNNKKLQFYIGDVRDFDSINSAMRGVDYVFHAAALKQVPSCEFYPLEAVKTNVLGTSNTLEAAINNEVERVICLSTDKAVYPINAMGVSKAMMEKVMVAKSRNLEGTKTIICGTRYGNVMASRGSVIPLFVDQMRENVPITITDPKMTRFLMSLDNAVELVEYAFENGSNGEIFVQKSAAATIEVLVRAVKKLFKRQDQKVLTIGTRHGEKLYETLLTREEMVGAVEVDNYYCIRPDARDLNYDKYLEEGEKVITQSSEYHSHNARQLNEDELIEMLYDLNEIQPALLEFGIK